MALILTSGPAAEPVSVDEAKAHMRVDGAGEDALISSLILTSRLHIEAALGLALIDQSWKLVLDRWPKDGRITIPIAPVREVTAIHVRNAQGDAELIDAGSYEVALAGRHPAIVTNGAEGSRPGVRVGGIEISLNAGYGASANDVPAPIRQALLMLVAHWYEHRDPIEIGAPQTSVPHSISRLLNPYRAVRI